MEKDLRSAPHLAQIVSVAAGVMLSAFLFAAGLFRRDGRHAASWSRHSGEAHRHRLGFIRVDAADEFLRDVRRQME
jgi:hypothetical protein